MSIPFIDLKSQQARIRDKIDAGLAAVLDHGAYIMGPEITALEERLAEWSGAKHNISCSSGTDALLLALDGLGLKPGQGVIVPSFTFAASAEVMPIMRFSFDECVGTRCDAFRFLAATLRAVKAAQRKQFRLRHESLPVQGVRS